MKPIYLYTLGAIIVLAIIGAVVLYNYSTALVVTPLGAAVITVDATTTPLIQPDETVIRAQVDGFGKALKKVSVLAPGTEFQNEMEAAYGAYVTHQLIAEWEIDPAKALGRSASSPWPDHIEIDTLIPRTGDGSYEVDGRVVASTSAGTAGGYPITMYFIPVNGTWLIASVAKGPYGQTATTTPFI